ncbi:MAG: twin-arginine translocase TatA/TatE family subunit [Anaerolineales bacterium]|nr:twin-arginine translocase TatA/TatE family subunit [Anaerolineales bacterium]
MFYLGSTELIIVLVIIILLFGAGRIGKIAGEFDGALKSFREGLGEKKDEDRKKHQ